MNAREVTTSNGGMWHGNYGTLPCPVCQPEKRRDQIALSVTDRGGRLLMTCHKSNCEYVDILHSLGVESRQTEVDHAAIAKQKHEEERRAGHGRVNAAKIWNNVESGRHMYLARKGFSETKASTITVNALSKIMRVPKILWDESSDTSLLVLPFKDYAGELRTIEFIAPDGKKCFMYGGRLRGSAVWMGAGEQTVLCEGIATGMSIMRSAGNLGLSVRVACAGSAGNMRTLAKHATHVMADNDASKTGLKVSRDIGLPFAMPQIVGMDFNDYELAKPLESGLLLSGLLSGAQSHQSRQTA